MFPTISQPIWEESIRKSREIEKELKSKSTEYLEGMIETYSKMKPFVRIKSLFGSCDSRRLDTGRLILTHRELITLKKEELQEIAKRVSPLKDFIQEIAYHTIGYDNGYTKREIAIDLLGKRKGMPFFIC